MPPFSRVYDALDSFKPKAAMSAYPLKDLKKGDILLVEMFVVRWPVKDEESANKDASTSKGKTKRREWRRWNVEFRLDSLSVLYPGSDYAQDVGFDDDDTFEA